MLTGENRYNQRKTWPNATLTTRNATQIGLGLNLGLQDERPAINHLAVVQHWPPDVHFCALVAHLTWKKASYKYLIIWTNG
jgi:hypothetical protein